MFVINKRFCVCMIPRILLFIRENQCVISMFGWWRLWSLLKCILWRNILVSKSRDVMFPRTWRGILHRVNVRQFFTYAHAYGAIPRSLNERMIKIILLRAGHWEFFCKWFLDSSNSHLISFCGHIDIFIINVIFPGSRLHGIIPNSYSFLNITSLWGV